MDPVEMVEKLREKTGLSYEEARAALERADWNLLDALIALEKEGKGTARATYATDAGDAGADGPDAGAETVHTAPPRFSDQLKKLWRWLVALFHKGNRNYLSMEKNGHRHFELPVTLAVLLLIVLFWPCIVLLVVALLCGCRFRFTGPDLGSEKVNGVMDKASEVADSIREEFRGYHAGGEKKTDGTNNTNGMNGTDGKN